MNIAFLLTPKSEVVTLKDTMTLRQAMETMEYHKYSAVPVIDNNGRYVYTLSEGDILWFIKSQSDFNLRATEDISINDIPRSRSIEAVNIGAHIKHVIDLTRFQNFVPVVDDTGIFIGMIKRSDLMVSHLYMSPISVLAKASNQIMAPNLVIEEKKPDYIEVM